MSSKGSYDPVGKARPQSADTESGGHDADVGGGAGNGVSSGGKAGSGAGGSKSSGGGSGQGFVVRVRKMERRNWIILAGAGLLVALVVIVAVVLVTMNAEQDEGSKVHKPLIMDAETRRKARPAFCLEEPEPGLCRAFFEMYHYNQTSDSCHMFVYGGCEGNANKFRTLSQCEQDCLAGHISSSHDEEEEEQGSVDDNTVVGDDRHRDAVDEKTSAGKLDDGEAVHAGVKAEERVDGSKKIRRAA